MAARVAGVSRHWFSSIDQIPGVTWRPLVEIDLEKLPNREAVMRVETTKSFLDERIHKREVWVTSSGQTLDRAPADEHRDDQRRAATPEDAARAISEGLALPGTPSSYHFLIIGASKSLHSRRAQDPRALGWIERLCLADIQMIEGLGDVAEASNADRAAWDGTTFPPFPSYDQLSALYIREGFVADACAIEERLAALGSGRPKGEEMISRRRNLLEENGR